jgi:hypothetical protein
MISTGTGSIVDQPGARQSLRDAIELELAAEAGDAASVEPSESSRVRPASAAPSGGRTQGGLMAAPSGRPRPTPREVCAAPPDVRVSFRMVT